MRKLRVLALMHQDLVPPDSLDGLEPQAIEEFQRLYDVVTTLRDAGHEVEKLGLYEDLAPLRNAITGWNPHIAFNLLEGFGGLSIYDHNVASYLELMRVPYTGCNPRGLMIARDKALAKKILTYHRVRLPDFAVFRRGRKARRPKRLEFPLIVKSLVEDASAGISQASVVQSDEKLVERVEFIHDTFFGDAIAEEYVEGRELYVGVLGNHQLRTWPPWELRLDDLPDSAARIATERVKFNAAYQKKHSIHSEAARDLSPELQNHANKISKRIYRSLELSGYARVDFRLTESGDLYFLEANPNPDIEARGEFALAAGAAGVAYDQLLARILSLGLRAAGAE